MLIENKQQRKVLAKWLIGIFASCILIYLGVRHIDAVVAAFAWLINLFLPIIWALALALIFNVPMRPIEKKLFPKSKKMRFLRRPFAIVLSFLFIFGLFIGLAFLVIPAFIEAVIIVGNNLMLLFKQLLDADGNIIFSRLPFLSWMENYSINWEDLNLQIKQRTGAFRDQSVDIAISTLVSVVNIVTDFFVGLAISIYFLYHKEKLKRQTKHLIHVWLPERVGQNLIHISAVFASTFQHFIAAQAIEAFILGVLCMLGMFLLRLPYAAMIGALVGITALLPIIGAYLGAIAGAFVLYTISPYKALMFLIFLFVLQQLEGDWIYPKVIGKRINLPPIWVLVALTIGGRLCGILGMFFGVPVFSAAYSLLKEATRKRQALQKEKRRM